MKKLLNLVICELIAKHSNYLTPNQAAFLTTDQVLRPQFQFHERFRLP